MFVDTLLYLPLVGMASLLERRVITRMILLNWFLVSYVLTFGVLEFGISLEKEGEQRYPIGYHVSARKHIFLNIFNIQNPQNLQNPQNSKSSVFGIQ